MQPKYLIFQDHTLEISVQENRSCKEISHSTQYQIHILLFVQISTFHLNLFQFVILWFPADSVAFVTLYIVFFYLHHVFSCGMCIDLYVYVYFSVQGDFLSLGLIIKNVN